MSGMLDVELARRRARRQLEWQRQIPQERWCSGSLTLAEGVGDGDDPLGSIGDGDEERRVGSGRWSSLRQLATAVSSPAVVSARKLPMRTVDMRQLLVTLLGGEGKNELVGGLQSLPLQLDSTGYRRLGSRRWSEEIPSLVGDRVRRKTKRVSARAIISLRYGTVAK